MMGRPHIEFIDALGVERVPITNGPFAGASQRVLSADVDGGGDSTALVHFQPAWSGDLTPCERPVELLVLDGTLIVAGSICGPGVHAFVPAGRPGSTLASTHGCVALVMLEPAGAPGGDLAIVDSNDMSWTSPPVDGPVPQGIVVKRLRIAPGSGDVSWVAAVVPGWRESRAEVHETVEECLMLKGDILLGRLGVMGPGSYFWRPPRVEHGPMFSLNGGLFFFRSKGGGLTTRHVPVPEWGEMVARYKATQPYFGRAL
jgi:hypothetical protein